MQQLKESVALVDGLVNRAWYTKLRIKSRLTRKLRVGFGPIATGENNLAERKWRIDPIINAINCRKTGYFASCFIHPEDMAAFDIVVIVKRFHAGYLPIITKMKARGARFLYDIVDNPNAGRKHGVFFGDCPEFSTLMDGFILSSPLHQPIAEKFSTLYELIEHPILNQTHKTDYALRGPVKILLHGYYENLVMFRELEPVVAQVSQEIGKPVQLIFHSEKVFPETEYTKYVRWTVQNSFSLMPEMDFAITAKSLENFFQRAKPSTKIIAFLAAGLPVICKPTPADELVVRDGETALFVRSFDDWSCHIRTLCQSRECRESLGTTGRRFATEHYSISKITDKYLCLLDRLTTAS